MMHEWENNYFVFPRYNILVFIYQRKKKNSLLFKKICRVNRDNFVKKSVVDNCKRVGHFF